MIGIGVDLVEVDRMRVALTRTPSLVDRLFTPSERAYAQAARDPAERFAVRFAAKEAVMKVLGVGLGAVDWHDIEVVKTDTGAPRLAIGGRARERAVDAGITEWLVTLSHTPSVAEAVVVAQ